MDVEWGRETELSIDLGGEQVLLERLEAVEALSTPFHMTLEIISALGELDLLPHLGKPASVGVSQDGEFQRHFHGLATEAEFTRQTDAGFHYRIVLRPWTYFLSHNRDFAIYQDKDALEIIKEVLEEAGASDVDYTRLGRSWPKRTYCVQYGESDFAFISRLMEEEGIYYFFSHSEDRHVLVLCDNPSSHKDGQPATLTYNPSTVGVFNVDSAARTESERKYYVQSWIERVSTGGEAKVTARDFDFEKPERPLEAVWEENQAHPRDSVEVYGYPFGYKEELDGRDLAVVVLDALRTDRQTYRGQSQATALSCGTKVTIENHAIPRLDGEYLIQQTFHSVAGERYRTGEFGNDAGYNVVLEAVPADTQWRSRRTTPKPIVHGLETAIITGPEGEEIFTDEYGRVKVRFHWDRSGSPGEKSTCWMRVSQTGGLGNIILPRVGHEVLVDFLGGDPDRPVVMGRVFNRTHMPVYELPQNKTIALWRTKTYGQSGNYAPGKDIDTGRPRANELRFEDKGGHEEVFVHAERDMKTRIRHNESHHVGCDQEIQIHHDRSELVDNNESVSIGANRSHQIARNNTLVIGSNDTQAIGSNQEITVGSNITITAGASITLQCGGSSIVMTPNTIEIVTPVYMGVTSGSVFNMTVGATTNITSGSMLSILSPLVRINS